MNEKIKTIKIIHLAICVGTIFAYIFVGNISMETLKIPTIDASSMIYLLVPIAAVAMSNFLFKSQLKQVDTNLKLENNFAIYQSASIVRWAILEGAAFVILFIIPDFIIFGILVILYLISLRPTGERIKRDLQYLD